jgi:hypothetical protein
MANFIRVLINENYRGFLSSARPLSSIYVHWGPLSITVHCAGLYWMVWVWERGLPLRAFQRVVWMEPSGFWTLMLWTGR